MLRIAVGGISHESCSFVNWNTTLEDFRSGLGIICDQQITERFRDTNTCIWGFIAAGEELGFEPVPLLWTFPYPSGVIRREDYEMVKRDFIETLRLADSQSRLDGLLLDMHGSMVIEGIDDGDGDVIAACREVLGAERPIIVTQDFHANHTQFRVQSATAIVGFDTYPHVDMAERGREAAELMVGSARGEIQPTMAIRQLPILWGTACQPTSKAPMNEVINRVHELESRPGVLTATIAVGYPWADVPEVGASVIVVTDDDQELAQNYADELGDWIWEHRERWYCEPKSLTRALSLGEERGASPIILADQADNPGGGAPGDTTDVLRTFIEQGLQDALVLYLVDPPSAHAAHDAGVGATCYFELGGRSHPAAGPPVKGEFTVAAVSDGSFVYDGPMYAGVAASLGKSAWLKQGGVSVVVVSQRIQPMDLAFCRTLGIDCRTMRYIAVKSAQHFRSGFEALGGAIYTVDAQGLLSHDFSTLPYTKRTRPMFPVEIPPARQTA